MLSHDANIELESTDKPSFDLHYSAAWANLHRAHIASHQALSSSLAATSAASFSGTTPTLVVGGGGAPTAAAGASLRSFSVSANNNNNNISAASAASSSVPVTPTADLATVLHHHQPPPIQPRGGRPTAEFNHLFALNRKDKPPFESTTIGSANRERDRRRVFQKFGVLPENGSRTAQLYGADGALLAVGYLRLLFGDDGAHFELTHSNVNWAVFSGRHTLKGPSMHFHEHLHVGRVKVMKTREQLRLERQAARRRWEREVDHRESALSFFAERDKQQTAVEDNERKQRNIFFSSHSSSSVVVVRGDAADMSGAASSSFASGAMSLDGSERGFDSAASGSQLLLLLPESNSSLDEPSLSVELAQQQQQLDQSVPEPQVVSVLCEQFRDVRGERNPPSFCSSPFASNNYRLDGYADYVPGRLYLNADTSVERIVIPALAVTPESVLDSILGKETQQIHREAAAVTAGRTSVLGGGGGASSSNNADASSSLSSSMMPTSSSSPFARLQIERQQQQRSEKKEAIETAMRFLGDIESRQLDVWRELAGSRLGGEGSGAAIYTLGALLRLIDHDPGSVKRFLVYLRVLDAATTVSKQQQLSERRIQQLVSTTPLFVRCPDLATQRWFIDKERARVGPNGEMLRSPHAFDSEAEIERRQRRRGGHFDEWMWQHRGAIAAAVSFCQSEHRGRLSVVLLAGRGVELCESPRVDKKKQAEEEEKKRKEEAEGARREELFQLSHRPRISGREDDDDDDDDDELAEGMTGDPLLDDALEFEKMHQRGGGGGFVSRFSTAIRGGSTTASSPLTPASPAAAAAAKKRNELQQRQQQILALRQKRLLASRRSKPIAEEPARPFRFFVSFDNSVVQFTGAAEKTRILNESVSVEEIGAACWSCAAGPDRPLVSTLLLQSIFFIEWVSLEAFVATVSRHQGSFDLDSLETLIMSNIQREKKMVEQQQQQRQQHQHHSESSSSSSSSFLPRATCPRLCARKWFWYHTPMVINGDQQARLLQTPDEFPGRFHYPKWWSFQFLDTMSGKQLRERLHAEVASKIKGGQQQEQQQQHDPHSLAARTGTTELTFAQKMQRQRMKKLGLLEPDQKQQQQQQDVDEEEDDNTLSPASTAKRPLTGNSKLNAEEDLTPYTGLEEFFRDGTYNKNSEFSKQLMAKRSRALTAATRLSMGISNTMVLAPKLLLKHLEKSRAQELFEQQLRAQQEMVERQRAEEAEKKRMMGDEDDSASDRDSNKSSSSSSSSNSTISNPFSDPPEEEQDKKKKRGNKSLSQTLSPLSLAPNAPGASLASPASPTSPSSPPFVSSAACFIFTVEDTSSNSKNPSSQQHSTSFHPYGSRDDSNAAEAAAAAASSSGELIGFCKGSIEFVHSCSSVPPERLHPYVGTAAGSSTSNSSTAWIVVRVDSLLVGERKVDASTLESNMRALAEREEEERKAAADPFYVPKFANNTSTVATAEEQQAMLSSLKKKPFARMDLALFIIKALFETFRSTDGGGAEHVFLLATVDHLSPEKGEDEEEVQQQQQQDPLSAVAEEKRRKKATAQKQLQEHFGMQSLSTSKSFWMDVMGCVSFAPRLMKDDAADTTEELVFHMFCE